MTERVTGLIDNDLQHVAANEKLRFFPLTSISGKGCVLTDAEGRQLLDFSAGWTAAALGYGHPGVADAVAEAISTQPFSGGISAILPTTTALAEALRSLAVEIPDSRVYLGNSGTDANDMALRACRAYRGRERIVAFSQGYHGGLGIAMGVSGVHVEAGATAEPGTIFLPYPNPLRPHTGDAASIVDNVLTQLEYALSDDDVAAVIVEPIQSDGGLVVPPAGFLKQLVERSHRFSVPVIIDEVKVGLGRTGEFLDFRHDGARPDIVTLGKALGGGLPLSAAIGPKEILDCSPASSLLTTAGNPVCAAAGLAVLRAISEAGLSQRAKVAGQLLSDSLNRHIDELGVRGRVGEVRGRGLTQGIDLVTDTTSNEGDHALARKVVYRAWQLGVVVFYVGGHVIEVTPPLIISDDEIMHGTRILAQSIRDAIDGRVTDEEVAEFTGW